MGKKIFLILACICMSASMAFAQKRVAGTVYDSESGEPLPGASVKVQGTTLGTVTNIDGKFELTNVPNSARTLLVSFMGMKPLEVAAGTNVIARLESATKDIDEVMVVAFGQQSRESFTGAATVVGAEELSKKTSANVLNAIVGEVPGMQMRGMSGAPGAGAGSITIRGLGSLYSDTEPLIIVDGAPYYASLTNIQMSDVESVTVLKDGASAALYGAAGANGVILITTKKGKSHEAEINVDVKLGSNTRAIQDYNTISDPAQYYEAYYGMMNSYYRNQGQDVNTANVSANNATLRNLAYNVYTLPKGQNLIGTNGKLNPYATLGRAYTTEKGKSFYLVPDNWHDAAYSAALRQEYNVSISSATERGNFFISAGYLNEDGIIEYSDYERVNTRIKADYQAKKWLKVGANVAYTHSNQNANPNMDTSWGATNLMYMTTYIAPIYPIYVRTIGPDGKPMIATDEYGHPKYDYGVPAYCYEGIASRGFMSTANPFGSNRYNKEMSEGNQLNQTYTADVRFTDWLTFNSTNNINLGLTNYSLYDNPFEGPTKADHGKLRRTMQTNFRQDYIQTLQFHKLFGDHDVMVQLGHEWNKTRTKQLRADAKNGFSSEVYEISNFGDRFDSSSSTSEFNREGWFGNALYNYDQKYFASAAYRRDGSSVFDVDHRWGNFGAIGAAWLINKENFFQNLNASWVDMLKLKFNCAWQGNDGIGNFYYTNMYGLTRSDKSLLPYFSRLGNKEITWETTENINVGLEFALFKNRLRGEIDFYNKKTKDLLFWISIPESFGTRGYYGNIGDIRNRGVEVDLSADIIRSENVTWNVGLNISHNRGKVLELPDVKIADNGGFAETDDHTDVYCWYREGGPLSNVLTYKYAGVYTDQTYQLTGDAEFQPEKAGMAMYWQDLDLLTEEEDGTKKMNTTVPGRQYSQTTTDGGLASRYEMGSTLPKVFGGFNTTLRFYGFDLSANFDYQIGGRIFDSSYQALMGPEAGSTVYAQTYHKDIFKSWSIDNPNSNIPRFQFGDEYTTMGSRFLTKASYLNFQSLDFGYTLPKTLTRKIHIEKLRVYMQGQNLCYWSKRRGFDPRYSFGTTADTNVYSPVRTISGGVQLTF